MDHFPSVNYFSCSGRSLAETAQRNADLRRGFLLTGLKTYEICDFGHYGCTIYMRNGYRVHVREMARMEVDWRLKRKPTVACELKRVRELPCLQELTEDDKRKLNEVARKLYFEGRAS